ncbi:CDP-alcohol phosphatidyltransferase family protein [Actinocorallia populi]|uniref:CDP-alcohol phosphatidyltransferase family protein n=1 Tax=Actinocorallia populi TaxID=2079200 RepID=UPI000D086F8D|nr:CDP-alcohol phosphatidyltransferase family protein [Actinocorallia populi]
MPPRNYSLKEIREKGQPPGLKDRRNEEHWAGRLYARSLSPFLTWISLRAGLSPNQLTYLMILSGLGAGVVFAWGTGLVSAIVGALLVQLYLVLDCTDGEVARVTGRTSITGVYLDRLGHYFSEVAVVIGLGFRAEKQFDLPWGQGGWIMLGLLGALGVALIKAETDNVVVARAKSGLPADPPGGDRALRPTSTWLALARQAASLLKFHRIIGAVELSLLILAAAVLDRVFDLPVPAGEGNFGWFSYSPLDEAAFKPGLGGYFGSPVEWSVTRGLLVAVAAVAVLQTVLHFVSIVASRRLK